MKLIIDIINVYRPKGLTPSVIHGSAYIHGCKMHFKLTCDIGSSLPVGIYMHYRNKVLAGSLPQKIRMFHYDTRDMIPCLKTEIIRFMPSWAK